MQLATFVLNSRNSLGTDHQLHGLRFLSFFSPTSSILAQKKDQALSRQSEWTAMYGRAGSSRDGASTDSAPTDGRLDPCSASPHARMSRRKSRSHHSASRSRSLSDASMSSRSSHSPSHPHSSRSRSPSPRQNSVGVSADRLDSKRRTNKTALRIDFLTHNVRESHLHHIFGWYGQVERVHLTPSRGTGKERDGSAYIFMSCVEEAAKAALYMNGGQIDGASLTIKTCEPPTDLPSQRPEMRSRDRPPIGIASRDRRAVRHEPYRAGTEWHSHREREDSSRAMHPDRHRMISTGRQDSLRSSNGYDQPAPMRRWGHPSDSRHDSARGRDRSASPPLSPRRGSQRRSSEAMRASPSY
ncbi:hypothetical protein PHSY_002782 [Pseudozyma hubeiensis SY62]|uniref:RRM domain-containing protein n=1 Tax=Pseudozyma hubeiensis (strain SY62) TaxID=1305764 RepID=R9P1Z4_PSEHS|nr:hypothetical protein PHSY_002782 [Pseudozyma hubeiensis SY62]GAC95207.1 hypothetical protein PHSY_002782 [Pseudozyma hubeiensis SY62]